MKQLFIALVVINLGYPVLQRLFGAQEPIHTERQASALTATSTDPEALAFIPGPEPAAQRADPDPAVSVPASTPVAGAPSEKIALVASTEANESAAQPDKTQSTQTLVSQPVPRSQDPLVASASASATQCVIAGPFRKKGDAEALVAALAKEDVRSTLQPRDTAVLPDYMVYVGPEESTEDARKLVEAFAKQNMDSHLITSGNLRNALSLGVFSRAPLADSMLARLKRAGYAADIAVMARNRRGFQVRAALSTPLRSRLQAADTPMVDCPVEPVSAALARVP